MNRDIMRKALLMQIKSLASLAAERVPTFEFDFSDEELNQLDDVSLKSFIVTFTRSCMRRLLSETTPHKGAGSNPDRGVISYSEVAFHA